LSKVELDYLECLGRSPGSASFERTVPWICCPLDCRRLPGIQSHFYAFLGLDQRVSGYHAVAVRNFTNGTNFQRVIHVLGDVPESVVSGVLLLASIADPMASPIAVAVANTLRRAILMCLTPKILP
jgi:hypothetical protein